MSKQTYDPAIRKTESGRRLYETWKRMRRSEYDPRFASFPDFYKWAMSVGYAIGDRLFRYDASDWYSPENCYWSVAEQTDITPAWAAEWCEKWDKTVSMIRRHFGLPKL